MSDPLAPYYFPWPFGQQHFDELISQPDIFAGAFKESILANLNYRLMGTGLAQPGNILIQSVTLNQNVLTVTFSPEGTRLLGLGQLSVMGNGSRPILVDAAGRTVEIARLTPNVLQRLAAISGVVVSVANVISAADLAHRMQQMETKLDLLIAYRRIDQEAKLEGVFYAARELCAGPISSDERRQLRQLRQELRELRIVLRKEWQRELEQIAQQQVTGFDVFFELLGRNWNGAMNIIGNAFQGRGEQKDAALPQLVNQVQQRAQQNERELYQQRWHAKFDPTLSYPFLIEFILRLEVVLAMASRDEVAYSQSLRDELAAIEQVVQYFGEQAKSRDLDYQFVADYRRLLDDYRQFGQALGSFSTDIVPVR